MKKTIILMLILLVTFQVKAQDYLTITKSKTDIYDKTAGRINLIHNLSIYMQDTIAVDTSDYIQFLFYDILDIYYQYPKVYTFAYNKDKDKFIKYLKEAFNKYDSYYSSFTWTTKDYKLILTEGTSKQDRLMLSYQNSNLLLNKNVTTELISYLEKNTLLQ